MSFHEWDDFVDDLNDSHYYTWRRKARNNIEAWGIQSYEDLLLAIQEELGELTQAYLEHEHENGMKERIQFELHDLAALIIQLQFKIELEREESQ